MPQNRQHFCDFGPYRLDVGQGILFRDGKRLDITPKEFDTLRALVERNGQVTAKDQLMARVWPDTRVSENNLAKQIATLRKKLGSQEDGEPYISTIPRRGYVFSARVIEIQQPEPELALPALPAAASVRVEIKNGNRARFGAWSLVFLLALGTVFAWRFSEGKLVPAAESGAGFTTQSTFPDREVAPCFSPDGEEIAFHSNGGTQPNNNIYRRRSSGGAATRVTTGPDDDRNPAWSPDGRQIAFIRNTGRHGAVYLTTPAGASPRKLTDTNGWGLGWSPDSQYLAIMDGISDAQPYSIVLVEVASGKRHTLVPASIEPGNDQIVDISRDGQHIAFTEHGEIAVAEINTRKPPFVVGPIRRLTKGNRDLSGFSWMPNSRDIVFSAVRDGNPNLFLVSNVPESQPQPLQFEGLNALRPILSRPKPGEPLRLAYEPLAPRVNLWRIELSASRRVVGKPLRLLASKHLEGTPQFSPDKKRILFTSVRAGETRIFVSSAEDASTLQLPCPGEQCGAPRWSPYGRSVAFDSLVRGQRHIYVAEPGKPGVRQLTAETMMEARPGWSRDGKWIYFCSLRDKLAAPEIWKVHADGSGGLRQITRHGGFEAFESPDGAWVYYVKSAEAPGLWKVPPDGGDEIPVLDSVTEGEWSVTPEGIFFMYFGTAERSRNIQFFSFAHPATEFVYRTSADATRNCPGFAASNDGRSIIVPLLENQSSEIQVVTGFVPQPIDRQSK